MIRSHGQTSPKAAPQGPLNLIQFPVREAAPLVLAGAVAESRCPFRWWLACDGTPALVRACNLECADSPASMVPPLPREIVELPTLILAPDNGDNVQGCTFGQSGPVLLHFGRKRVAA